MRLSQVRLPVTFDTALMQKELSGFSESDWIPHFNKGYYTGDWSVIPFRSVNGDPARIFPDPTGQMKYADTIQLHRCPYLKQVIDHFDCEKTAVRLLRLKAGSVIKEHSDYDLSYEDGEVRLHIPVVTNPGMAFYLNRERVVMNEGECWYLNFNLPHSVNNSGATDRVHLVIDCRLNPWMEQLFQQVLRNELPVGP